MNYMRKYMAEQENKYDFLRVLIIGKYAISLNKKKQIRYLAELAVKLEPHVFYSLIETMMRNQKLRDKTFKYLVEEFFQYPHDYYTPNTIWDMPKKKKNKSNKSTSATPQEPEK